MGKSMYEDPKWIGQKFGKLTIIGFDRKEQGKYGVFVWKALCDCGKIHYAAPSDIKSGKVKSCGCYHDAVVSERATKFKHKIKDNKRLYNIFNGIKNRCFNEKEPRYKDYGGRGITMCDEWRYNFDAFVDWALSHGYTEEMTIERNDVNGNYCPENCSWIPLPEQRFNQRGTIWVDYKGEHIQLMKLCKRLGITYDTVHNRICDSGWDVEKAIETPSMFADSLSKKAREHGLNPATVSDRIKKFGWSEERALNTPTIGRGAHKYTYREK